MNRLKVGASVVIENGGIHPQFAGKAGTVVGSCATLYGSFYPESGVNVRIRETGETRNGFRPEWLKVL